MTTLQRIAEKLRRLPADKQQEVLDFVEFLEGQAALRRPEEGQSFAKLASAYIGAVDGGPGDLATNKEHLQGWAQLSPSPCSSS